jgi:hypothetical protein
MDFRTAAASGFERLYFLYTSTDFLTENAFWFAGNSLHTCLSYLIVSGEADHPGRDVLQTGLPVVPRSHRRQCRLVEGRLRLVGARPADGV